jgi:hypothetical protein
MMGKFILQLALALSLLTTQAHAQNTDAQTRPIKPEEIIGTWGVVAFMPGSFGEKYPSSDYLTPSQIYGFYEDGHMRNLVSDENKQFNYNLEELEQRFGERPSTINYKFLADGIVAITVDEKKEIGTLWQAHIITENHMIKDIPAQKGDLIMGMTPEKESENDDFRYIRLMRKSK